MIIVKILFCFYSFGIRLITLAGGKQGRLQSIGLGIYLAIHVLQTNLKVDNWESETNHLMDCWGFLMLFQKLTPANDWSCICDNFDHTCKWYIRNAICYMVELSHLCLQCSTLLGIVWDDNQNHCHPKFTLNSNNLLELHV